MRDFLFFTEMKNEHCSKWSMSLKICVKNVGPGNLSQESGLLILSFSRAWVSKRLSSVEELDVGFLHWGVTERRGGGGGYEGRELGRGAGRRWAEGLRWWWHKGKLRWQRADKEDGGGVHSTREEREFKETWQREKRIITRDKTSQSVNLCWHLTFITVSTKTQTDCYFVCVCVVTLLCRHQRAKNGWWKEQSSREMNMKKKDVGRRDLTTWNKLQNPQQTKHRTWGRLEEAGCRVQNRFWLCWQVK